MSKGIVLEYLLIGSLVGSSLALTGSGGALLAIPLLIYYFDFPLKVANFFSLIIVSLAALIGVMSDFKKVKMKESLLIVSGSFFGSYLSLGLKSELSEKFIFVLLSLICFMSLYLVWRPIKNQGLSCQKEIPAYYQILVGLILGILSTLTGLGGGVLLLPLFISLFGMDEHSAVGTSLVTIFLSSIISFILQTSGQSTYPALSSLLLIVVGVVFANVLVKRIIKVFSTSTVSRTRKVTYSLIVVYTLVSISIREFA